MTKDKRSEKAAAERDEALIDESLEESFPASDPMSPAVGHGQPHDETAAGSPAKAASSAGKAKP